MGACLSSTSVDSMDGSTCAFVISTKGELRHYPTPIFVSEVLNYEKPDLFVCSSDSLYYDTQIPDLDSDDELDAGQIYFILPKTMLGRRLSASDMAALAVKASLALNNSNSNSEHKNMNKNKARISPLVLMEASQINIVVEEEEEYHQSYNIYKQQQQQQQRRLRVMRSGSIRKTTRNSYSKKARLPLPTFRLSTIYEHEGGDDHL